jgi:hypothetical protein
MTEKYSFPEPVLAAAYMGAHANRYAVNMLDWFPGSNWNGSFRYAMKKGLRTIKRQISGFPKSMTLKEITGRAPTYWES